MAAVTLVVTIGTMWGEPGPAAAPVPGEAPPDTPPAPVVAPVPEPDGASATALVDVAPVTLPPPRPIRIMPLGDSITHGYTTPAGYRLRLAELLADEGWEADFVGSLEHGPAGFADAQHEGHGTFRIDRITAGVPAWVGRAQPDVVLLMAGTNDLLGNFDPAGAPSRLDTLLDAIATAAPTASVLVASIPPITDELCGCGSAVAPYNAAVRRVVAGRARAGYPVSFVDMSAVAADHLPDGIHPDEEGHEKIADAWFRALDRTPRGVRIPGPAPTARRPGYWLAAADGGVFALGRAGFHGSATSLALHQPVVGVASTPTGMGYWLVAADGAVLAFGDAGFHGSAADLPLSAPVVGIAPTPTGRGYWLVSSDGGVFAFGDARFLGAPGAAAGGRPVVAVASTPSGGGYWVAAADGGVFAFGDARFAGAAAGLVPTARIVGLAPTPTGAGYWLAAADGGIFTFGDAPFLGSATGALAAPVVGIGATPTGRGYLVATATGDVRGFGDGAAEELAVVPTASAVTALSASTR